nr:C-type lectin domain family 2 member D-like [Chrysemys picta bellii]
MLKQLCKSNSNTESGGESGHAANSGKCTSKGQVVVVVIITILVLIIIVLAAALGVVISRPSPPCHPAASWCPDGWFRNRGKCYYFSKAEGNWTYSQSVCSSHAASLAGIDNLHALGSLLPYKGKLDHWIGLWKDVGQVWKWANGTEFDHRFQIQGGADCAFLDEDLTVSSSSCSTQRKWICCKLDAPTKEEEHAVGGDS